MKAINIWVDDERTPPEGWMWCKTSKDAIGLFELRPVEHLSLDYVLGNGDYGHKVMEWLRDHPDHWPTGSIVCHSSSNDAVRLIEQMVKDFAPTRADR